MNGNDIALQNGKDAAAAKVLIKMRTISSLCDELAHDANTPDYFRARCKETCLAFRNNARYYARIKELAPDTKAISIRHFEAAYQHVELAMKGAGAGFTTKFVKMCARHTMSLLVRMIARSRKKAHRIGNKKI